MKKIIALAIVALSLNANAQRTISYPAGASSALTVSAGSVTALTVSNQMNHVASIPTLTVSTTITITLGTGLKAGATMLLMAKTTATETTTFAGAIVAPAIVGVAGKTWSQAFIYNGTNFYPCGAKIQVD
jgi:hypothetical protein